MLTFSLTISSGSLSGSFVVVGCVPTSGALVAGSKDVAWGGWAGVQALMIKAKIANRMMAFLGISLIAFSSSR
jgi:hypothetical protein